MNCTTSFRGGISENMYLKYQNKKNMNPKDWVFSEKKIAHVITHVYKSRAVFSNKEIMNFYMEKLNHIADKWDIKIIGLAVDFTHIHLAIELKPYKKITNVVRIIKGGTSYYLRKKFSFLKKEKRFWADSFYVKYYDYTNLNKLKNYFNKQKLYCRFQRQK